MRLRINKFFFFLQYKRRVNEKISTYILNISYIIAFHDDHTHHFDATQRPESRRLMRDTGTHRDREKERKRSVTYIFIHTYIYIYVYLKCIWSYIHVYMPGVLMPYIAFVNPELRLEKRPAITKLKERLPT